MTPAEIRADYRKSMVEVGWTVKLKRNRPSPAAAIEIDVLARITGFQPDELTANMKQGDAMALVLAEDVEGTAFTLPFIAGGMEKIVDGTKVYNIQSANVNTRKIQGVAVAYEISISG